MPDAAFADPRLARLYDTFEGERDDLSTYLRIVEELGARHVLDIGCGTGTFALLLAETGRTVTAVDPAWASLEVARQKAGADAVTWLHGDVSSLPELTVDAATMTGNVAQVFLTDEEWCAVLGRIRDALRRNGHLVFETRNPERRAWEEWAVNPGTVVRDIAGIGAIEQTTRVTAVELPYVSFDQTYTFPDGTVLTSPSTLRFRTRDELGQSLATAGYQSIDVRDAPDRPGREYVFIARR